MNNFSNFKEFFEIENRTKYFVNVLLVLSILSIIVYGFAVAEDKPSTLVTKASADEKVDPFSNIDIEARSAIVWDVINNRAIYSKNPNLPLPLASLTKVMTALTADQILGNSSKVQIKQQYLEPDGDSKLLAGDTWKSRDLSDFTLITSSNDGALALASVAESEINDGIQSDLNISAEDNIPGFIDAMNETASKVGLSNSKFYNEHGLDEEADRGGAYGSAKDMAKLVQYILKYRPSLLEATRYKNLEFASNDMRYDAENTNLYLDKIPDVLASKTGYTDLAGGNLVVAFDAGLNRPIIISVLGSSQEGRFSDTLKLVDASQKYLQEN